MEVIKETGYNRIRLYPKREYEEGDQMVKHFMMAESRFHRMLSANPTMSNYHVVSVDVIQNPRLWTKFESKQSQFQSDGFPHKPVMLFHGTRGQNIVQIVRDNFRLDRITHGRVYGDGVYFSEQPELSVRYSGDTSSLLLCQVLLGKSCVGKLRPGFNSAEVYKQSKLMRGQKEERCWAVVVPDIDQIYPAYVINFSQISIPNLRHFVSSQNLLGVTGGYQLAQTEGYRDWLSNMGVVDDLVNQVLSLTRVWVEEVVSSTGEQQVVLNYSTENGDRTTVETITLDKYFTEESFMNCVLYKCQWSWGLRPPRLMKACCPPLPWQKAYNVIMEFSSGVLTATFMSLIDNKVNSSCQIVYVKI